jgi:hypothetical protein
MPEVHINTKPFTYVHDAGVLADEFQLHLDYV